MISWKLGKSHDKPKVLTSVTSFHQLKLCVHDEESLSLAFFANTNCMKVGLAIFSPTLQICPFTLGRGESM